MPNKYTLRILRLIPLHIYSVCIYIALAMTASSTIQGLKDKLVGAVANKKSLMYILIALCFIIAAYYTYKAYVKPTIYEGYKANSEFVQAGKSGQSGAIELYFFYTNWCPHCKTAKPIWQEFKDEMSGKKIKGRDIVFLDVDCEADPATAESFNVKGYPTIKLVKDDQIIEYDAKPNKDTLMEFLNSSI